MLRHLALAIPILAAFTLSGCFASYHEPGAYGYYGYYDAPVYYDRYPHYYHGPVYYRRHDWHAARRDGHFDDHGHDHHDAHEGHPGRPDGRHR